MAALSSTVRFELGVAFPPGRLGVALLRLVLRLFSDDDKSLVRASVVLKSQGRKKLVPWETRSPLGAHKQLALCPGHRSCGKIHEKNARGVAPCGATGPGCVWYYFMFVNEGRDLAQYI